METKRPDLLSRLPSVGELLEKPQVRALADRWNRSTVAAGVRSFLDELRNDLQRRASDAGMPSPRELAERAARFVFTMQQHSERPAINATGRIMGRPWAATPVADAALERMYAVGRHFLFAPKLQENEPAAGLSNEAAAMLCRMTGAEAAAAVHSYAGALWIALAATAAGREVVIARGDVGEVEEGCSLAQLARSAGATLREVGAANRATAADYEAERGPQAAAILVAASDTYAIVGETRAAEIEAIVASARDRDLLVIDALGAAPLVDFMSPTALGRRSVQASLASGADVVLVRGDGLVGGPTCGLIVGRREVIQRIVSHPLFAAWQLDALRTAAFAATLEHHETKANGQPEVPLMELLTASVDNLRNRAERLAPQLTEAADVSTAEAIALQSPLFPAQQSPHGLPSYGIALSPADGNVSALERRLAAAPRPLVGRIEGERLLLDLRLVFPREDEALVEIVSGNRPSMPSDSSAS